MSIIKVVTMNVTKIEIIIVNITIINKHFFIKVKNSYCERNKNKNS